MKLFIVALLATISYAQTGNGYVIEASGKSFPGSLGFYFQIVSDAEVCSSYCGSQGSSFFQWQISNNNCGCAQADTTMSDAVDNSDFNIYRIIDINSNPILQEGDVCYRLVKEQSMCQKQWQNTGGCNGQCDSVSKCAVHVNWGTPGFLVDRGNYNGLFCAQCESTAQIAGGNGNYDLYEYVDCLEPTSLPSSAPTECPTPVVGDFGGDLIETDDSKVLGNGRISLDFTYSSAVVTDFDITMDKPGFDYSSEDVNGWTEKLEMCWSSIQRNFTYNQLSKAMDFEVYATEVNFAVDTSWEYSKHKSVTIGGKVHEWTETHTRSKHMPFKMTLPQTSKVTTAFSGKNPPFKIETRAPTTSMPTFKPTTSIPTIMPSNEPTSSEPTNAPVASQPTIGPITSTPTKTPSDSPTTTRPTSTPFEPTVTPTTSDPTPIPSSSPTATNPSMAPSTSKPSLKPTLSPSTLEPTMKPSYNPSEFTSLKPSANPLPTSDVITTIVPYISTETSQKGQNPVLEVQFTTIVNEPWKLIEPEADGTAITNLLSFAPTKQDTCDNFEDLEQDFLKQSILYCQRWVLRFEGDRHCNSQPRSLHIDFISQADNGQRSETTLSWDLDLGSSPAFECAHDS